MGKSTVRYRIYRFTEGRARLAAYHNRRDLLALYLTQCAVDEGTFKSGDVLDAVVELDHTTNVLIVQIQRVR